MTDTYGAVIWRVVSYVLYLFMFPSALADGGLVMYPFSDKETEALEREVTCPGSRSQAVAQPALKPESSTLGAPLPHLCFSNSVFELPFHVPCSLPM